MLRASFYSDEKVLAAMQQPRRSRSLPMSNSGGGRRGKRLGKSVRPLAGTRHAIPRRRIMSAAFSAIMITGEAVLPDTMRGMIEASDDPQPADPTHAQIGTHHRAVLPAHPATCRPGGRWWLRCRRSARSAPRRTVPRRRAAAPRAHGSRSARALMIRRAWRTERTATRRSSSLER